MVHELKAKLIASRNELIKAKGDESLDYIKRMIEDTKQYCETQGTAIAEVCSRCDIADYILEESQDLHVGSEEKPY